MEGLAHAYSRPSPFLWVQLEVKYGLAELLREQVPAIPFLLGTERVALKDNTAAKFYQTLTQALSLPTSDTPTPCFPAYSPSISYQDFTESMSVLGLFHNRLIGDGLMGPDLLLKWWQDSAGPLRSVAGIWPTVAGYVAIAQPSSAASERAFRGMNQALKDNQVRANPELIEAVGLFSYNMMSDPKL